MTENFYPKEVSNGIEKFVSKQRSLFIMSLFIASIASGSNGNCYYIGNHNEAVLIDAGISCRETESRMRRLQLPVQKVKAVFISHEHSDHIQGLSVLCRKYQLPVYITEPTLRGCGSAAKDIPCIHSFLPHQPVQVGSLMVTAFPKQHDAAEPHSFIVSDNEITVGIFTDIGSPCYEVIRYFKQCHAAFLEANYDEAMLANGRYPHHLKKRIAGAHGHLSNSQALELFTRHRPVFMSHLLLSHLSKENNHPQLVEDIFNASAGDTQIVVASRYRETDVFEISKTRTIVAGKKMTRKDMRPLQLSMFD